MSFAGLPEDEMKLHFFPEPTLRFFPPKTDSYLADGPPATDGSSLLHYSVPSSHELPMQ